MEIAVIQMTEERLREHLTHAAQLGAHLAMQNAGLPVREYFTRAEMMRRHGSGYVRSLIEKGKLTPHRERENEKGRVVYSETELLSQIV